MNIYNKSTIIKFYKKERNAKLPLEIWQEEVNSKTWKSPNQLKQEYRANISILKNGRVVFNIKGNNYRLVATINCENEWLFIKFIGTHKEYNKKMPIQLNIAIRRKRKK
ncbi:MAG: type II toxin-antitoxin system HigB family toxin [Bacteroidetes bacterium]|nr:type II toxin-antitoxin system HigB family toxin [Bacteroidota bacterium]